MAERASTPRCSPTAASAGRTAIIFRSRLPPWSSAALVGVVPLAAGMITFFDPLRRQGAKSRWFRVGSLDSLDAGRARAGDDRRRSPRRLDRLSQEPIGAIFLVADADGKT